MSKKITAVLLAAVICAAALLSGCSGEEIKATASTDNYRNYYEIFVYSFCDSNGDGIGDINGIIQKLDYLNDGDPNSGDDLGIDGIWLMPIMPSPSYHKYDITDYYDIDETYGTIEDFEKLSAECDKRGIDLIIDLVLNHTSSEHEWFQKTIDEVKNGEFDGEYSQMYSIPADGKRVTGYGYQLFYGTSYSYECNFAGGMPDLDLSNDKVREEIKKIVNFWVDKGVDGFRLDAVKYFESPETDGDEFLKWFTDYVKSVDEGLYLVGEEWEGNSDIAQKYKSGIDSLFNFTFSNSGNRLTSAVNSENAKTILNSDKKWNELISGKNENAIDAVFLSNHDMARSGNAFKGDPVKAKMAAALYMLMPGNSYIYYGEEVGLLGGSGNENDASWRIAMPWSYEGDKSGTVTEVPPGVAEEDVEEWSPEKSVEEQQKDENSLMRFYKKIIDLKLQNPEIARGKITKIIETPTDNVAGALIEYNDSAVILIHNLGKEERTVEISKDDLNYSGIRGQLTAQEPTATDSNGKNTYPTATLNGTTLTIPAKSTVILK
ncbi:MAG: alpha-amylase family glycosyl hydrolase [Acutalibacteraceae bacterium]